MPWFRPRTSLVAVALLVPAPLALAQDPDDNSARRDPSGQSDLVARMMKFDTDKDGKLTRNEITDDRLVRLFTRADANKDGSVTPTELEAVEAAERPAGGPGFGGPGGPGGGGPGGPGGGGPGGPGGGPGGFMGAPPKPGEVLPAAMRARLKLTTEQQTQLDELQRDVDARMAKILTDSQKTQLKQMATMRGPGGPGGGPGGPGGRGGRGPGGPGGSGGPPPGDDAPPRGPR